MELKPVGEEFEDLSYFREREEDEQLQMIMQAQGFYLFCHNVSAYKALNFTFNFYHL